MIDVTQKGGHDPGLFEASATISTVRWGNCGVEQFQFAQLLLVMGYR